MFVVFTQRLNPQPILDCLIRGSGLEVLDAHVGYDLEGAALGTQHYSNVCWVKELFCSLERGQVEQRSSFRT